MTTIVRVFMSGRRQALLLPARLRLRAKEFGVEQIGNGLWLHPQTSPEPDMGRWLQQFYARTEPLPENFLADRQDVAPQERDWS